MTDESYDFYVVSSSGSNGYCVTFSVNAPEESLSIECSCPAGENRQMCKHKAALIMGDDSIYDPEMEDEGFRQDEWARAQTWVKEYQVKARLAEYESKMKQLEAEKLRITNVLRTTKKHFAQLLFEGIPLQRIE